MAFDQPPGPEGGPPPGPPPHNDRMVMMLQQRLGALTLANIELEARLAHALEERDALAAKLAPANKGQPP